MGEASDICKPNLYLLPCLYIHDGWAICYGFTIYCCNIVIHHVSRMTHSVMTLPFCSLAVPVIYNINKLLITSPFPSFDPPFFPPSLRWGGGGAVKGAGRPRTRLGGG